MTAVLMGARNNHQKGQNNKKNNQKTAPSCPGTVSKVHDKTREGPKDKMPKEFVKNNAKGPDKDKLKGQDNNRRARTTTTPEPGSKILRTKMRQGPMLAQRDPSKDVTERSFRCGGKIGKC